MTHRKRKKTPRVARSWKAVSRSRDPLARARVPPGIRAGRWLGFVVAGAVVQVAVTAAIAGANNFLDDADEKQEDDRVVMAIIDEPKPEPVVQPPPPVETVPEPKLKAKPKAKPKPKPKRLKAEPPPDPIDIPKPSDKPPPERTPPKKIAGLNFESTVSGGNGPSFGTGNTRMGETATTAVDPRQVGRLTPRPVKRASTVTRPVNAGNRRASHIPAANVELVKPKRTQLVKPTYPPLYREQGLEGEVVVEVALDARGKVKSATIVRRSKHALFNEEARRVARKQRFTPARRDGVPIPFRVSFTIRFRLDE